MSDQENKGNWFKYESLSDEFDGNDLDTDKWTRNLYWWKGRQPALFMEKNVTVSNGKLHLTMYKEEIPEEFKKFGYHDYSSAALHSKIRAGYGYRPLYLIFDSETMPDWFGMPEDDDLPSTFSVEYVRAWRKEPNK